MADVAQIENLGNLEFLLFSLLSRAQTNNVREVSKPAVDFGKQSRPERGIIYKDCA